MVNWLVIIGLILIPFANCQTVTDQTFLKEYLGLMIAMTIAGYTLYTKGLHFINNKWILFVLLSMLFSTVFVPMSGLVLGDLGKRFAYTTINIDNLWNYKPILIGLIYLLMVCAISYTNMDERIIMKVIAWVGFIMALVVIAQKFGFQEFWRVQNDGELAGMRHPELMGFMAQYTLVAAFLSICQMAALFTRKFYMAIFMGIAIFLTGSHFAILCVVIAWMLWLCQDNKGVFNYILPLILLSVIAFLCLFHDADNGRFAVWTQIWNDVTHPVGGNRMNPSFGFFGFGAGAFSVFFPIMHTSPWGKAHNDFLEFLFNNGIFGLGMLLASITVFFKECFKHLGNKTVQFCLFTFIIICILANGTFIWQLGWGQFYTAVIVGLVYSAIRKRSHEIKLAR